MAYTFKHGDRPLEGYEIQRAVGRGGFGEVYYAISDGGREVALKYLRENPEVELRGISQCINLKSPHLVSIFDVRKSDQGDYFVVMEYVSGPNLRDMLIAESKGLGVQKAAFFAREIAKGLGYLHDRGIVHRDLKPGNIFYEDGYVKICDYGLSKFVSMSRHSAQTASVGTVHYMAPEVGSGNYSKGIDIYALGVILYEMLLGKVPYDGASMGEILMKHLTQQPEVDELPEPFPRVIRKALAKDPADRYQDVNELINDIFDVDDVKQSVLGFEPASLTIVAQRAAAEIRPSPVPSDNPAIRGPQPVRGANFSERFVHRTQGLQVPLTKQERKEARRREKKKKNKRGTAQGAAPGPLGSDDPELVRASHRISFGQRLGRLFAACLVTAGLGLAFGALENDADLGTVVSISILASVLGLAIGHKVVSYLGPERPWLIEKLVVLVCTAPAVLLVYSIVCDAHSCAAYADKIYIPFLAGFVLVDWRERIRMGQRGQLGWWEAVTAGMVGFIASAIAFQSDTGMFLVAGWIAGISIALQAFAWATVRNPLPQWAPAPEAPAQAAGLAMDQAEADTRREESAVPEPADEGFIIGAESSAARGRPRRSTFMRIMAVLVLLAMLGGILTLSLLMGLEFRSGEEFMGATVGIVAMGLIALSALARLGRYRRPTFWGEWLNPFLRIVAGTSVAAGGSALGFLHHHGEETVGFIVLVVMSSILYLILLIFRGRRTRELPAKRSTPNGGGYAGRHGLEGASFSVSAAAKLGSCCDSVPCAAPVLTHTTVWQSHARWWVLAIAMAGCCLVMMSSDSTPLLWVVMAPITYGVWRLCGPRGSH